VRVFFEVFIWNPPNLLSLARLYVISLSQSSGSAENQAAAGTPASPRMTAPEFHENQLISDRLALSKRPGRC
jgi:hypothetical protein